MTSGDPRALAAAIDRVLASSADPAALVESAAPFEIGAVTGRMLAHARCATGDTSSRRSA